MTVQVTPIPGVGEVEPGDDIGRLLLDAMDAAGIVPEDGDVVVVTHKIVSKAEGEIHDLDPDDEDGSYRRLVEREAAAIVRRRGDLAITITSHGFICANAGVDRSNVALGKAVGLPRDPDASAHTLRTRLERATGCRLAVVITDTFGRAWRRGLVDVAIGASGLPAILDLRGTTDAQGRILEVTEVALIDEIAAAADLVMGKAAGIPAALIRGLDTGSGVGRAADLVRPPGEDLFR